MSTNKEPATLEQARALRAQGPGRVTVTSTTSIGFVTALRETTALLSEEEAQAARAQLNDVADMVAGIEGETSTLAPKPKRPWWVILLPNLRNASKEEIARANHNHLVNASGVAAQAKPAPRTLVLAAEANLTAEAAGTRIDAETRAILTEPWATASVE